MPLGQQAARRGIVVVRANPRERLNVSHAADALTETKTIDYEASEQFGIFSMSHSQVGRSALTGDRAASDTTPPTPNASLPHASSFPALIRNFEQVANSAPNAASTKERINQLVEDFKNDTSAMQTIGGGPNAVDAMKAGFIRKLKADKVHDQPISRPPIEKAVEPSSEGRPRGRASNVIGLPQEYQKMLSRSAETSPSRVAALISVDQSILAAKKQFGKISSSNASLAATGANDAQKKAETLHKNDRPVAEAMIASFTSHMDYTVDYSKAVDAGIPTARDPEHFDPKYRETDASDVEAVRNLVRNMSGL